MKQNKSSNFTLPVSKEKNSKNISYTGIRSLFKEPLNLFQPNSESSGVFTKNYKVGRYK